MLLVGRLLVIWDYMEKMPESSKLKNPLVNAFISMSPEEKGLMSDVMDEAWTVFYGIILEGKSADDGYKKIQEIIKAGWGKYGKIITDQIPASTN